MPTLSSDPCVSCSQHRERSLVRLWGVARDLAPGRLQGRAQPWPMLAGYMAFDSNGILGIPMSVASTIVVAFILFGSLLSVTGG